MALFTRFTKCLEGGILHVVDLDSTRCRSLLRGHLQTKIFMLNVIVTLKGGGGLWQMNMTLIFEISIARVQKNINSMQVQ